MRKRKLLTAVTVATLALAGCGSDDSDDDGNNNNGGSNPNPPTGQAVPSSFSNSATSNSDLNTKTNNVKNDIVLGAKSDLGMSLTSMAMRGLFQDDLGDDMGDDGEDTAVPGDGTDSGAPDNQGGMDNSLENFDFGNFGEDLAEGSDCSGLFEQIEGSDTFIDAIFSQISSNQVVQDDFSIDEAAAGSGYKVEKVTTSGDKYAWHIKLSPADDSGDNPYAFLFPEMELAAGATDTEVVALFATEMDFDSSKLNQGGDNGAGEGEQQSMKFSMKQAMEMYANTATKQAVIGMDIAFSSTGGEKDFDMKMIGDITIQAGDNPSLSQNMNIEGIDDKGQELKAYVTFNLSKEDADSYKLEWSGSAENKTFEQSAIVSRSGNTCKIESI